MLQFQLETMQFDDGAENNTPETEMIFLFYDYFEFYAADAISKLKLSELKS